MIYQVFERMKQWANAPGKYGSFTAALLTIFNFMFYMGFVLLNASSSYNGSTFWMN